MYHFQPLHETDMQQLMQCINSAFSDYEQPICFTPESLKHYLAASAVDLSLSFGAFCEEQPVAFILNSSGTYQNQNVVFDAGTGVVPDHRGKGVFSALFEYTCAQLEQRRITKYYLEVLQSNHHAVAIYSKKGFSVQREYSVLTASGPRNGRNPDVATVPYPDFKAFPTVFSVDPSFEHTTYAIDQNPLLYEVLCLSDRAYCIYAKRNGEINQIHYNDTDALREIMCALIDRYPRAMAKNIDCSCSDVIELLTQIGFVEILKQYEMAKDI